MTHTSTATALRGPVTVDDVRIDYITAYWHPDEAQRLPEASLMEVIDGEEQAERPTEVRDRHGIQWWGTGSARIGRREGERYVRLAGDYARDHAAKCLDTCSSVSRVDCAVTVSTRDSQSGVCRNLADQIRALPAAFGCPRTGRLIDNLEDGETFELGSRRSDVMLRFYDWGVRHDVGTAGCRWRYEVELKGPRAKWARSLLMKSTQRELAISALVASLYTDRRINVPWTSSHPISAMETPMKSTDQKKLLWLRKQVAPCVGKLVDSVGIEEVLSALGLSEQVTINPNKT